MTGRVKKRIDVGRTIVGKVDTLTASELTLSLDAGTRTVAAAEVTSIVVRDPVWRGALIGLALGLVIGTGFALESCAIAAVHTDVDVGSCRTTGEANTILIGSSAAGALVGAGIDRSINRRITLTPVIGPKSQRMLVSIRF